MGFSIVGDLIAHAGGEGEFAAVVQLGVELALQAKQDMSLAAPVVGEIAGRVFHHADAYISEVPGSPERRAVLSFVLDAFDAGPLGNRERDVTHAHKEFLQFGKRGAG
jgi:hypothetical protein